MIKSERAPECFFFGKHMDLLGIIRGKRPPCRPADKYSGHRMKPCIAFRVGVDPQHAFDLNIQGDLFFHFPAERMFDRFADIDKSPRKRHSERRIFPLDQYDADKRRVLVIQLYNAVNGEVRCFNH